jgi:hypothetical protein
MDNAIFARPLAVPASALIKAKKMAPEILSEPLIRRENPGPTLHPANIPV